MCANNECNNYLKFSNDSHNSTVSKCPGHNDVEWQLVFCIEPFCSVAEQGPEDQACTHSTRADEGP